MVAPTICREMVVDLRTRHAMSLQPLRLLPMVASTSPFRRSCKSSGLSLIILEFSHVILRYNSTVRCHIAEPPLKAGGVTAVP